MSSDDIAKESKVRLPKWRPQGPHAAAVARAYWAGTLDLSVDSYRKFLDNNQTLAQHYGINLQKGRRNLRANILRLLNRIQYWKDHAIDPKTGNQQQGVNFSPSFLKRGNFPPRPETVDDVPANQLENFEPGRDNEYEEVIREEREEASQKSEASQAATLPPVLTDQLEDNNDNKKTSDKEEEEEDDDDNDNSFNLKLPSFIENNEKSVRFAPPEEIKVMTEPSGKLIGSTSQLEPVFAELKGNDPDWQMYGQYHTRDILLIRFVIPDGYEETSLKTKVSNGGTVLSVTASMILSKFDARYTIGKGLRNGPNGQKITLALGKELTTIYSDLPRNGEGAVEKKWKIELPVTVEKEPRNPNHNWHRCRPGAKGFISICNDARSVFCYVFYFVKEKEDRVNPHDQTGNFMDISAEEYDTRLGLANLTISRNTQMGQMFEARAQNMTGQTNNRRGNDASYDEETIGDTSMASRRSRCSRSRRSRHSHGGTARSSTARRSNVMPDGMNINVNRPINANNYVPNSGTSTQYDPRRPRNDIDIEEGSEFIDTDIDDDTRRSRSRSQRFHEVPQY